MSKGSETVCNIPSMEGGSGEHSYANNSLLQSYNFHTFAKPRLSQALDHLVHHIFPHAARSAHCATDDHAHTDTPACHEHLQERQCFSPKCTHNIAPHHRQHGREIVQLKVADFGCSYGPNTLDHAACIVRGIYERVSNSITANKPSGDGVESAASVEVEMQYFFSDLPGNNFNALLQSLQPFMQEQHPRCSSPSPTWKLFSGAVAGSFHGPLFPTASLHLAVSIFALHWLSQVPLEVVDRASPAWNGGHIWIHGTRPMVVEAYARQFQKDMKAFLLNRAKEIANGGILFLFFPGRAEKFPEGAFFSPNHDIWTGCLESTWEAMVLEGLIREEERDMFNIPFYNCHETEMQEALDNFPNEFKVVKMDVIRDCSNLPREHEQEIKGNPQAFGNHVKNFVASLMKPMIQGYLGESRANELFQRLQIEGERKAHLSTSMSYDMLFAIIQRL